jgi:hypothetical protein
MRARWQAFAEHQRIGLPKPGADHACAYACTVSGFADHQRIRPVMLWSPEWPKRIDDQRPLREVLATCFPEECASLPIARGWGHGPSGAIVFSA